MTKNKLNPWVVVGVVIVLLVGIIIAAGIKNHDLKTQYEFHKERESKYEQRNLVLREYSKRLVQQRDSALGVARNARSSADAIAIRVDSLVWEIGRIKGRYAKLGENELAKEMEWRRLKSEK